MFVESQPLHRLFLIALLASIMAFSQMARADILENVRYPAGDATAAEAPTGRCEFNIPRAVEAPVIDGEATDACWQQDGAVLGEFTLGLSGEIAQHRRIASAVYDDQMLYLKVRLQREPGTELRDLITEPDDPAIWEDDEFEIFLDPFSTGNDYYQIILNSAGVVFDAAHTYRLVPDPRAASPTDMMLERQTDMSWTADIDRAIAIHDSFWNVEVAIPLSSIGLDGAPQGHRVRFNITSADWDTEEYTTLCPNNSWHDPKQFGALVLGTAQVDVTDLRFDDLGVGRNLLVAEVNDLSGQAGNYVLAVDVHTDDREFSVSREFRLEADSHARAAAVVKMAETDGEWACSIRILDAAGRPVFAARRSGELPEPIALRFASKGTLTDGAPVAVAARIGLGRLTARRVILVAELADEDARVVSTQNLGRPGGSELRATMPVNGLAPGRYTLRLKAVQGSTVWGSAHDMLHVGASPFDADTR